MLAVRFRRTAPLGGRLVLPLAAGAAPPAPWAAAAGAAGFRAEEGAVLDLAGGPLLLGLGTPGRALDWERAGAAAALALKAGDAVLDARGLGAGDAAALAAGMALGAWRFDRYRRRPAEEAPPRAVTVLADDPGAARAAWRGAAAAVKGCLVARDWTTEPANVLTTRDFVRRLRGLARHGIEVEVWGRKRLAREGYGALLAVGQGSAFPPRLVTLRWKGSLVAPPVAFVGKGLVFDTGGISIKGAQGMEAMRADMAGAAACAGAMLALARRNSPCPAVAVLAIAENATGAASYRPGDVLRTGSGRTVEVIDTDAEGRLVLADALHHAVTRHAPRAVVDLATLTGAVVTALGHHRAGLFGNDGALAAALAAAGEAVGEPLWPLPIGERHREDLRSDIADLRQCQAGRLLPDACHAAAFLEHFVGDVPWAHLDIAGVDTQDGAHALGPAGATGFGARLLDRWVAMHHEEADHHAAPGARG
ncbi:leucyl aminopeptidase family protein [Falsiroseomonas ponticola]|uniref:leucyl aminopeptidase family protein n=1 Tax=Falsiroseomonas ponticola TaxID=2786951 RepID=UPI0019324228|nr:M17 family peptidase N-terminal domain-containing protein [Roseomonas ponticola]